MMNFDKENDKEFMREALKLMHEKLVLKELEIIGLKKLKEKDEEILQKLEEELKNLRKRVFASQQERKANKPKNHKKRKIRMKIKKKKEIYLTLATKMTNKRS